MQYFRKEISYLFYLGHEDLPNNMKTALKVTEYKDEKGNLVRNFYYFEHEWNWFDPKDSIHDWLYEDYPELKGIEKKFEIFLRKDKLKRILND